MNNTCVCECVGFLPDVSVPVNSFTQAHPILSFILGMSIVGIFIGLLFVCTFGYKGGN